MDETEPVLFIGGDDVDRNVPRVRIALQKIEERIAVHVGQSDIERDRVGPEAFGQRHNRGAFAGDDALEPGFPRHVEQDRGEALIVLHDQNDGIAAADRFTIVDQDLLRRFWTIARTCVLRARVGASAGPARS